MWTKATLFRRRFPELVQKSLWYHLAKIQRIKYDFRAVAASMKKN